MLPLYQGRSCLPSLYNYTADCTQGGYPTYAVNVSTALQIQLAVNLIIPVVLANGHFITASSTENPDIFWMLRGGGGSTIGVVTSLTIKALPKLETTTVTFNFTVNDTPGPDAFWSAVEAYLDNFEAFVDAGTYGY